jgi:hypothetical protein
VGRERGQEWHLVDHEWKLLGFDPRADESIGRLHVELADGLADLVPLDPLLGPDPHPRQHVQEACAAGVESDVVDRELGAGQRGGADEEGRRRRISRHGPGEAAVLESPQRDPAGRCQHRSAECLEGPFGVIAG